MAGGERPAEVNQRLRPRLHVWLALQRILRLLADAETAALVTGLLKRGGGIARLADEAWLAVSAPQGLTSG